MENSRKTKELDLLASVEDLLVDVDDFDIESHKPRISKKQTLKPPFEDELDKLLNETSDVVSQPVERKARGAEAWGEKTSAISMFKSAPPLIAPAGNQQSELLTSHSYAALPEVSAIFSQRMRHQDGVVVHPSPQQFLPPTENNRPQTALPAQRRTEQSKPPIPPLKHGKPKSSIFTNAATSSFGIVSGSSFKNGMS